MSDLAKKQANVISKLQDEINLQRFEIIELNKEIRKITREKNARSNIILKTSEKLQDYKRQEVYDLKKINEILRGLRIRNDEED